MNASRVNRFHYSADAASDDSKNTHHGLNGIFPVLAVSVPSYSQEWNYQGFLVHCIKDYQVALSITDNISSTVPETRLKESKT